MAITWTQLLAEKTPEKDYDLAVISDQLWEMGAGSLETIKEQVSPEVFHLFIAMNLLGNWEGEGWGCLIGDQPVLLPYATEALEFAGFAEIAQALGKVLEIFPDFVVFTDDQAYCNVVNFLQNTRFPVLDKHLKPYREQRKEMSRLFHQRIDELEQVTKNYWLGSRGWGVILRQVTSYKGDEQV